MRRTRRVAAVLGLVVALAAAAGDAAPPRPGAKDKCPVCGMFVAKYPDWTATVLFQDGSAAHFDGAKDLFKFLARPAAFGKGGSPVARILVTDYYAVAPVEARQAFFVQGGDVFGPMGKELVPFAKRSDAEEFMKDHRGRAILRFDEVTPAVLASLE